MKAEIIAVGTEMLMGQIVNTNARDISLKLAELGIDVYFQTVVGDNAERIRSAIEIGRTRADLLLFTGGLGPTQDDITKDVLAQYLGRELEIHAPSMATIEHLFSSRGLEMVQSNVRQAHSIVGATPLHNAAGLAVGNALIEDGTMYVLLPGPPKEMRTMLNGPVVEWLRTVLTDEKPLYSRLLKFAGIGESNLEAKLLPLIEVQDDPTIAPYAKEGEVSIRVSTKADSLAEANRKIDETVTEIDKLVGEYLYAQEDIPMEVEIVHLLQSKKLTIASAESCTGGLFSLLMTKVPTSSDCFDGGIVTYTNDMKQKLLGIPMEHLEGESAPGAVSTSTAGLMAERVRELLDSDYGVSTTGVAGPGTTEGKPVGMVFIGIAARGRETKVFQLSLSGDRDSIQLKTVKNLQYRLWQAIKEHV
ncbi:MAG: competence/damage-inducible protein A [Candidatus Pristimantibacillus lignocellulolyticus]|uniref:Putative competence-damage inducible protein n=1 Tax=Candidatus Pristimantibacillus lignocellulolyticus TaxID=2994561 RepID=A0A9J6ZBQ7_9BACL|nr:MAG: competence/damage-inducible protein A [Candidatus Pristimantibacillus lignocellulolyticus]